MVVIPAFICVFSVMLSFICTSAEILHSHLLTVNALHLPCVCCRDVRSQKLLWERSMAAVREHMTEELANKFGSTEVEGSLLREMVDLRDEVKREKIAAEGDELQEMAAMKLSGRREGEDRGFELLRAMVRLKWEITREKIAVEGDEFEEMMTMKLALRRGREERGERGEEEPGAKLLLKMVGIKKSGRDGGGNLEELLTRARRELREGGTNESGGENVQAEGGSEEVQEEGGGEEGEEGEETSSSRPFVGKVTPV